MRRVEPTKHSLVAWRCPCFGMIWLSAISKIQVFPSVPIPANCLVSKFQTMTFLARMGRHCRSSKKFHFSRNHRTWSPQEMLFAFGQKLISENTGFCSCYHGQSCYISFSDQMDVASDIHEEAIRQIACGRFL